MPPLHAAGAVGQWLRRRRRESPPRLDDASAARYQAHVRMLVLLALVLASSCAPSSVPQWRAELATWQHPAPLPSFPLVDDGGRAFYLADLKGAPLVIGFVFSRCAVPDACPSTMTRLRELQRLAPSLRMLVVTLDPEHDTPAILKEYGRWHDVQLGGELRFATGTKEVVDAMASLFNVIALRRGQGEIAHPVKLALLDKELRPVHEWLDNRFDPREIFDASAAQ